jgi:hypothetical protein
METQSTNPTRFTARVNSGLITACFCTIQVVCTLESSIYSSLKAGAIFTLPGGPSFMDRSEKVLRKEEDYFSARRRRISSTLGNLTTEPCTGKVTCPTQVNISKFTWPETKSR